MDSVMDKIYIPPFLNPLKCDMSFLKCNYVVYYIGGMILLLTILFILYASKVSRGALIVSAFCHCFIFLACSTILLNLCMSSSPKLFTYFIIGVALLCTSLVIVLFGK